MSKKLTGIDQRIGKWAFNTRLDHRKRGHRLNIPRKFLFKLMKEANGTPCIYCNTVMSLNNPDEMARPSLDIINPLMPLIKDNVQICCRQCNSNKGSMSHEVFIAEMEASK
jgi:hypothetical protein